MSLIFQVDKIADILTQNITGICSDLPIIKLLKQLVFSKNVSMKTVILKYKVLTEFVDNII